MLLRVTELDTTKATQHPCMQKLIQHCKAIILRLKKKFKKNYIQLLYFETVQARREQSEILKVLTEKQTNKKLPQTQISAPERFSFKSELGVKIFSDKVKRICCPQTHFEVKLIRKERKWDHIKCSAKTIKAEKE